MPKRRYYRGAASRLLLAFVHRNNDVDGYWALGKLYKHALKSKTSDVCVDLLAKTISPPSIEFVGMIDHFQRLLADLFAGQKLSDEWLKSAIVRLEFRGVKSAIRPGDTFAEAHDQ
jgi:hypothetical protein